MRSIGIALSHNYLIYRRSISHRKSIKAAKAYKHSRHAIRQIVRRFRRISWRSEIDKAIYLRCISRRQFKLKYRIKNIYVKKNLINFSNKFAFYFNKIIFDIILQKNYIYCTKKLFVQLQFYINIFKCYLFIINILYTTVYMQNNVRRFSRLASLNLLSRYKYISRRINLHFRVSSKRKFYITMTDYRGRVLYSLTSKIMKRRWAKKKRRGRPKNLFMRFRQAWKSIFNNMIRWLRRNKISIILNLYIFSLRRSRFFMRVIAGSILKKVKIKIKNVVRLRYRPHNNIKFYSLRKLRRK